MQFILISLIINSYPKQVRTGNFFFFFLDYKYRILTSFECFVTGRPRRRGTQFGVNNKDE